jgi:hypothetical protein
VFNCFLPDNAGHVLSIGISRAAACHAVGASVELSRANLVEALLLACNSLLSVKIDVVVGQR